MSEAGAKSPHLEEEQKKQAERSAPLRATVIHEVIRKEGLEDLELGIATLMWSGLAAGLNPQSQSQTGGTGLAAGLGGGFGGGLGDYYNGMSYL